MAKSAAEAVASEEPTAAQSRPRRAATDVSYDKDGRLVTAVVDIDVGDSISCPIAQRAVVASVGRAKDPSPKNSVAVG